MYNAFCLLLVTLILLVNSGSLWKLREKQQDTPKRRYGKGMTEGSVGKLGKTEQDTAYGGYGKGMVEGKPPCSLQCGKGKKFTCVANCTHCPVCSRCNTCSCHCVPKNERCSSQKGHQCASVLEMRCNAYRKGCYCYCAIASLKLLGAF
uniref:TNFR-Cys domain-containing protein n=1 Tax=Rhipicephalus appendiculatus TaxID=34631 RepID=A0A131YTS7_RHIAP